MTTLGYTRSAPNSAVAELVACAEAILGIFFIGVFISRWVNAL
jgi:ion channel